MTTDDNLLLTPVAKHYNMEWQEARAAYEQHIGELQKVLDSVQGPSVALPSITLIPPDLPELERLIALEDLWKSARREAYRLHWEAVSQEVAIKKALFVRERPDAEIDKVEDLGALKERHIQAEWDRAQANYSLLITLEAWRADELQREQVRHVGSLEKVVDPVTFLTEWEHQRHAEQLSRIQQEWGSKGEQWEEGKEGGLDYLTSHGGGD